MIVFNNEIDFKLENPLKISKWISDTVLNEEFKEGEINFIFCSDSSLLEKNVKFLKHNTLTDIISFDYTMGSLISGDIFISIDRVRENAQTFEVSFTNELHRVIIHGILHYCGFKDKTPQQKLEMRSKEDFYLNLR
jgi:probable rRNA maturation factor|tara:strand:- start:8892 stop:9299 length:408 start_codon:yes stop_codon:yes gene_type:complete